MPALIKCSRCHEPLGEGIMRTGPEMLCKKCMDSFLDWREIMRSKEAKE